MNESKNKSHLLGIGLDNQDGHKRLTIAENFTLVGGSEQTHERMTEMVVKTVEDLKRKGKSLEEACPKELSDTLQKNIPRE